jgi:hypothetical protein
LSEGGAVQCFMRRRKMKEEGIDFITGYEVEFRVGEEV